MPQLSDALLAPKNHDDVVKAVVGVIDAELAAKSGLGGMALKAAYAALTKIKEDMVPRAVATLLPNVATRLDTFFDAKGDQPFGLYLASRSDEAAEVVLSVVDDRANATSQKTAAKLYSGVRGKAKPDVEAALPRLGAALEAFVK